MEFLRICFGATVIEGYGMTETACTITMTHPDDTSSGHVGGPLPCCEIKLADLPEMNYLNSDRPYPRGEVCCAIRLLFLMDGKLVPYLFKLQSSHPAGVGHAMLSLQKRHTWRATFLVGFFSSPAASSPFSCIEWPYGLYTPHGSQLIGVRKTFEWQPVRCRYA